MATQTNKGKKAEDNNINYEHVESSKKRSNGRRKIPIQMIMDKTRKHVTFSKRRAGLFKKASELCALCGVEITILTFSERGKLFCFGHPDPDDVVRRYISGGTLDDGQGCDEVAWMVEEHNKRYEEIRRKINEEKKFDGCKGQNWNNGPKFYGFWWDEACVDEMGLDELEQFMACLLGLRRNVVKQFDKLTGANLSFHSNRMDQLTTDPSNGRYDNNSIIRNSSSICATQGLSNSCEGVLNNDSSLAIMAENVNAKMDNVSRYNFGFEVMSEFDLADHNDKEFGQFSSIYQGMESLDLNAMENHQQHHQADSHQHTFRFEGRYF